MFLLSRKEDTNVRIHNRKSETQKNTDENSSVLFVLYRIEQEKIVGLLMNFSELINLHRRGMTTVYSSYAGLSKTILR